MVIRRKRKFILGHMIGKVAMAIVYEAIDHETEDRFAAKEYTFEGQVEAALKSL